MMDEMIQQQLIIELNLQAITAVKNKMSLKVDIGYCFGG